jgi:hypothetical protein
MWARTSAELCQSMCRIPDNEKVLLSRMQSMQVGSSNPTCRNVFTDISCKSHHINDAARVEKKGWEVWQVELLWELQLAWNICAHIPVSGQATSQLTSFTGGLRHTTLASVTRTFWTWKGLERALFGLKYKLSTEQLSNKVWGGGGGGIKSDLETKILICYLI